jgi:hypothetical protein
LPYHCEFTSEEIRYIKDWVLSGGGLFLLGYYFADTHHECNASNLARAFDFEFSNNLIMPPTRTSHDDCQDQAFELDPELSVKTQVTDPERHPIVQGVANIAFLSACSLKNIIRKTEYDIETPPSAIIEPEGRPTPQGYLRQIRRYVVTRNDAVKVLAAWRYPRGKVVASGTWKLCTLDYGDNGLLMKNIIRWLSQPSGAKP